MEHAAVPAWAMLAYLISGVFFILALRGLSSPASSRRGNRFGMAGMLIAVVTTLVTHFPIIQLPAANEAIVFEPDLTTAMQILGAMAIGAVIGIFTARKIDANEAKSLGLISRVCAPEALPALLLEYTTALADNAPLTVRAAKVVMREILKPAADFDAAMCQQAIRGCFESEDYAEGRRAFMEKRKPVFTGK